MADEVLRVTDLHAWYGESHVLHGMSFSVRQGEVVTLLGRNGSGRTSTLKAILGLVGKRTGSIVVNGVETVRLPTYRIAHLGVGYCPEERGIFSSLSVEENLIMPPEIARGGMSVEEIYGMFPNLRERRTTAQGTKLSGGERRRRDGGQELQLRIHLVSPLLSFRIQTPRYSCSIPVLDGSSAAVNDSATRPCSTT
jgi:branched-chain amino acid transport system ATP-binding protein